MKNPFRIGDTREYRTVVTEDKLARFADEGLVHPVYGTFALAQDAEWVCRLFVLEMKEAGEEGVGSFVSVRHVSPAPLGSEVRLVATLERVEGNAVWCRWQAFAGERLVAEGEQEQRILDKARFERLLDKLKAEQG